MTEREMRKTKDYEDAVNKIKGYSKGFEFTLKNIVRNPISFS